MAISFNVEFTMKTIAGLTKCEAYKSFYDTEEAVEYVMKILANDNLWHVGIDFDYVIDYEPHCKYRIWEDYNGRYRVIKFEKGKSEGTEYATAEKIGKRFVRQFVRETEKETEKEVA